MKKEMIRKTRYITKPLNEIQSFCSGALFGLALFGFIQLIRAQNILTNSGTKIFIAYIGCLIVLGYTMWSALYLFEDATSGKNRTKIYIYEEDKTPVLGGSLKWDSRKN